MNCFVLFFRHLPHHFLSFLRFICVLFSYRQVFELFLKDIVAAYNSGAGPIFDAVGRLDAAEGKAFRVAAAARFPSMSAIDRAVRNPIMQKAVWEYFGFEHNMVYPVLSGDLMYGTLSNAVHNVVFKKIPVSDMADDSYKRFLAVLGNIYHQTVDEYSEMDASTYEDEQEASGDGDGDGDDDEKKH